MARQVTSAIFVLMILPNILFVLSAAGDNSYPDCLKTQAVINRLDEQSTWRALLHYHPKLFSSEYKSQADNPDFFFSAEGTHDPRAELMATIDAMFRSDSLGDDHPQCTFPARFAWLKKVLPIDADRLPNPECCRLQDWKQQLNANQVTIVFPTAYLNNPSSMFGHLFLRFDPPQATAGNPLMAYTISFSADTSAQQGVADYLYRGLFGGFPSTSAIQRFYERFKRYADIENRDIWEYRLNFSPEEMDQLVRHVWELKGNVFDYYFLDENCAYRLISLLDVARQDLNLAENFTGYTIPSDAIRALRVRGAVQHVTYRPSAVKTFYHHAVELHPDETQLVVDIVKRQLPLDDPRIEDLPAQRRALILALSSEYLALLINKDALDRKMSSELTSRIMVERIKLSLPVTLENPSALAASPDAGHETHRLRVGSGWDDEGRFFSLGYRAAYHSLFDPLAGFERGAQVELFNVELNSYEADDVQLEHLMLMDILSLTPIDTYFQPVSWRFALGAEQRNLKDDRELVNFVKSDMGLTVALGEHMLSGMVHLETDLGEALDNGYGLASGLWMHLACQTEMYSYGFSLLSMKYLLGDGSSTTQISGRLSIPVSKNDALFSEIEYTPYDRDAFRITLGVHHFF